ncbi:MAG: Nif11-like leader peptide family natural product precursor [Rhodospirillales bacterium]|nr:Nif11-like leader peptide family natural product precursor [Rhodospirillales bacterium]
MSLESVLTFFRAARDDAGLLARYDQRTLSELVFHAKNDGFDFSAWDLAEVSGRIEASVILAKDRDPFDGSARLWRRMWGRYHLGYLVEQVRRHSDDELTALIATRQEAAS